MRSFISALRPARTSKRCTSTLSLSDVAALGAGDTPFTLSHSGSTATFTVSLSNDGERWTEENYAVYSEDEIFRWHWYAPKTKTVTNGKNKFANALYDESRVIDTGENGARVAYSGSYTPYPPQTARYVRLTVMGVGLKLYELSLIHI